MQTTQTHLIHRLAAVYLTGMAWGLSASASPTAAVAPVAAAPVVNTAAAANCPALLNKTFLRLQDEKPQSLCQYAGQVVLVVNTASYCGFTSQYKDLEALYSRFKDRGFVVLGFPSNDFGKQEPGSAKEIAEFCANTYGVKFPMFAKSVVRGDGANPLHAELTRISGSSPKWNFHKYLIARDGRTVLARTSLTGPQDDDFVAEVEKMLVGKK